MMQPYEMGYCPVCGFKGWEAFAGDDYDDCPCCDVDFCQFTARVDDPTPPRIEWLARVGLTAQAFRQLVRNLGLVPEPPASWPVLVYAAALGKIKQVRALLDDGAPVDASNERGEIALMWAAWMEHVEIVELLLDRGANREHRTNSDPLNPDTAAGGTPLSWAARSGNPAVVEAILNTSPAKRSAIAGDVNATDPHGVTPLMAAAATGPVECLRLLCEAGADVNRSTSDGTTALTRAAESLHPDAVRHLLKSGCDVDAYRENGDRPLTVALQNWHENPVAAREVLMSLLNAGADANVPDRRGTAPIEHVIGLQDEAILELFIAHGAEIDYHKCLHPGTGRVYRSAPLVAAARPDESDVSLRILRRILDATVDVSAHCYFRITALHSATINGNWRAAEMLIAAGADLEAVDSNGLSPLFLIAKSAPKEWIERLIVPRVGAERARAEPKELVQGGSMEEMIRRHQEWIDSGLWPSDQEMEELE